MLTLNAVYALPNQVVQNLMVTDLRADWFPEVPQLEDGLTAAMRKELENDGRLVLKRLLYEELDWHRFTSMHTLWWDGRPVMLVQNAGRAGSDVRRRRITDAAAYRDMCCYLLSKVPLEQSDEEVVDADAELYEEELFCLHGQQYAGQLGFRVEEPTPGVQVLPHAQDILSTAPEGSVLVLAVESVVLAEFIRRGHVVLKKLRLLTDAELDSHPRIRMVSAKYRMTQFCFYETAPRPANTYVMPV